jgi:hypothetical protein
MTQNALIIRPNRVFHTPFDIIVGSIVTAPKIIPQQQPAYLYLAGGRIKQIILETEMTSSPEAMKSNTHAFRYHGDQIDEADLDATSLLTNLSFDEAVALLGSAYQPYLVAPSDRGP